ncbi:MAG: glycine cleavage system aminomethyltransferase GcvT [Candidatus Polarisedimenticolaceae bacterium]|nr:glycine cleavage system aminomethyltransferase GcvT [Candidatus Polarisedimenticolaceae bacterium]
MNRKTALNALHRAHGGRMVPFADWDMPLHYGSQMEEHHAVRRYAGMFDVSHMLVIDLAGEQSRPFLQRLLANDVVRLQTAGKALYSCMLNEQGGVIDDLIVYYLQDKSFRIVVNAGCADKDLAWIKEQATPFAVAVTPRPDLALIAVQGPQAREKTLPLLPTTLAERAAPLPVFHATVQDQWCMARTGYTGEDGFEIMLPATEAPALWQALAEAGVTPCGLGARDTLRLEAGMNLYGSDMDEQCSPLESGLGWTVAWEPSARNFIGRKALETKRNAIDNKRLIGLLLEGRGVLRNHQKLFSDGIEVGEVTSGGFAPTLQRSIALARVQPNIGEACSVEIRGRQVPAKVVRPPFVRKGKICIAT